MSHKRKWCICIWMYAKITKAMGEQYREVLDPIPTFCTCALLRSMYCDKSLARDYRQVCYRQEITEQLYKKHNFKKKKMINQLFADAKSWFIIYRNISGKHTFIILENFKFPCHQLSVSNMRRKTQSLNKMLWLICISETVNLSALEV